MAGWTAWAFVPTAVADHGFNARYVGNANGCNFELVGEYASGGGTAQQWKFVISVTPRGTGICELGEVCNAKGHVEGGFTSIGMGCVGFGAFEVAGTNHWHDCCLPGETDQHDGIAMRVCTNFGGHCTDLVGSVTVTV